MSVDFGYFPEPLDFSVGDIAIATLPGLSEKRRNVEEDAGVDRDWIYAPLARERRSLFTDQLHELPYPNRVFGLAKTHSLTHATATDAEHLSFLVWTLGFILGIRLTDTEAGFLDATPIKPGTLHDISWRRQSEQRALGLVDTFWRRRGARISKGLIGVVHALFLSHKPQLLGFEELNYIYTAIDGCHAIWSAINGRNPRSGSHRQRLEVLCHALRTVTPTWISMVVDARNNALHDALFFGEPLGFAILGGNNPAARQPGNIILEMQNLVCRFVCAILELPCHAYISSDLSNRGIHGVELL